MLDQQTLDRLWNFTDPALSEQRFRDALADPAYTTDEKAELTTQLGRAIGLQERYEEADALLDSIDCEEEPTVGVRVLLERGRLLTSSGHAAMAAPLLEQAAELGDHLGEEFDQTYMAAMAEEHQKAVDLFQKQAEEGEDPELKSFAEEWRAKHAYDPRQKLKERT